MPFLSDSSFLHYLKRAKVFPILPLRLPFRRQLVPFVAHLVVVPPASLIASAFMGLAQFHRLGYRFFLSP
jgi:hypothetical protein